ncbi:hypothetical protein QJS10_CPB20g01345 [Acorus calamus]|uniref:Uncharacterized protein n=1 Tax=Acorus calamus TaxID=4465 RepID=A0AAV9CFP2_ACOCL|nr:hypothetical protein QJS10_CPB20g01345 [Acorus calamus]
MEKLTTHTPDYLDIPSSVWPSLGGAPHAGEGVVIGMIDTGIDPNHPSFDDKGQRPKQGGPNGGFNGTCETGRGFPRGVCGGKIAAARYFALGAIANGDFNASRDYASPFDADGHGRQDYHTAAIAAGNYRTPVMVNGFNYGYASGMAPGAHPWIVSVAASDTDRKYNNSIELGNGQFLPGSGLAPPTSGAAHLQIAVAGDLCRQNDSVMLMQNCMRAEPFVRSLARGKIIVCSYIEMEYITTIVPVVAETMRTVGAAGFILTLDYDLNPSARISLGTVNLPVPGIVLDTVQASSTLWKYYNANTAKGRDGTATRFGATARILDGRHATYTGQSPVVASYSSRGPDVNNAFLQTADLHLGRLEPESESDSFNKGQHFALLSGTSMAAPHVAGVAALIKQRNPHWTPAMVTSALSTTARGPDILADRGDSRGPADPFDCGAGFISPARALDPGLVLEAHFEDYLRFLCAVPGVDGESVMRAVGTGCAGPTGRPADLNVPSVVVSNLVGSMRVMRRLTNVGGEREVYNVTVREPSGVSVRVAPQVFAIERDGAEHLRISIRAESAINEFVFGEIMLKGDRGHVVRIPLAISVTSTLGD